MRSNKQAEELYVQYQQLVPATLYKRYPNPNRIAYVHGLELDDLLQFGRMGLFAATQTFDPSKGCKFQTYAINNIKYSIDYKIREYSLFNQNKRSYEVVNNVYIESITADNDSLEDDMFEFLNCKVNDYEEADSRLVLEALSKVLSSKTMEIIKMRLEHYTYEEIGNHIGLSRQRVKQIIDKNEDEIRKHIMA